MAKVKKNAIMQSKPTEETEPVVNKYYLHISDIYMRAKYAFIIILVLFITAVLILFRNDITYANLMYLLRDFNTDDVEYTTEFDPIRYDEQDNMSFAVYRGELAVIGNRSLKLYSTTGNENRSYTPGYSDPVALSSDKYLLTYDIGTDLYSVYTSIAAVYDGKAEGTIEDADINNNGDHLLVCRSTETKYIVYTYDSGFDPIAKYYKNGYVTSAAIGDDGQTVIASFVTDSGISYCEIEYYLDGHDKPSFVYNSNGIFPVKCGIWDDGGYYVICSDRILFFSDDGEVQTSFGSWSGFTACSVSGNRLAVSKANDTVGSSSEIIVFDSDGESLFKTNISGKVSSLAITENALYSLSGNTVSRFRLDSDEVETTTVEQGGADLVTSGNTVILCKKDGASGLVFDNNK